MATKLKPDVVYGSFPEAAVACLVVMDPSLKVVHRDCEKCTTLEPYAAGFLGMREVPLFEILLGRVKNLTCAPQVCGMIRTIFAVSICPQA